MDATLETFRTAVSLVPQGRLLVAVALVVCVGQLCAIVLAFRRRLSPGAQAAQGASILLIPIVAAASLRASWATAMGSLAGPVDERARALSDGLNGLVNAGPLAASGTLIAAELWAIGLAVALAHREPDRPETAARAAVVFVGLSATLFGVVRCAAFMIHQLASLAGLEPDRKATVLMAALDFAHAHLLRFAALSRWTILGLGVLTLVLVVRGAGPPTRRALARQAVGAAALLVVAAGLAIVTRPMRAENELPWPAPSDSEPLLVVDPVTPDLVGPDPVERAPVVQVFVDRLALDGIQTSADDLRDGLLTLRNNQALLQPDVPFNGLAIIVADRLAPMRQVTVALSAVHEAGYLSPSFVFTREESSNRPVFGRLTRVRATAVHATLFDRTDDQVDRAFGKDLSHRGVVVPLKEFTIYDSLARRLIAVRRTGSAVPVRLGD